VDRIAIPTRLQGAAIDRVKVERGRTIHWIDKPEHYTADEYHWRVWLHTNDHQYGTFLELHDDGSIVRVTVRDGYDERTEIKPKDE
jgi:hypothetical protein